MKSRRKPGNGCKTPRGWLLAVEATLTPAWLLALALVPTFAYADPPPGPQPIPARLLGKVAERLNVPQFIVGDTVGLLVIVPVVVAVVLVLERRRMSHLLAQARAELAASHRERLEALGFLEAIGDATPDLLWARNREGEMVYQNRAAAEDWGLIEAGDYSYDEAGWAAAEDRCLRDGEMQALVGAWSRRDGASGQYRAFVAPIRDATGSVTGTVGQITDVTEAWAASALLRGIGDAAPFAIVATDADLHCTYANKWFLEGLKRSETDVIGRTIAELFPGPDAAIRAAWRQAVTTGERSKDRISRVQPDGSRSETLVRRFALRDPRGEIVGAAAVAEDLTREEGLKAQAAEAAERYRMVSELTPNILWSLTTEGGIDFVNERWEQFVGPGQPPEDWATSIHPEDRKRALRSMKRAQKLGRPWREQFRLLHRTGTYRWVLVRAFLHSASSPQDRRFFGSFTDIDELVTTQQQARVLQAESAHLARVADIGQMASSLAHEINQPLAAATNYVEGVALKLESIPSSERAREGLDFAARELIRAGDIVRRLRDFLHKRAPQRAAEPLERLVRDAAGLALLGVNGGISVAYEFAAGPCDVWVDRVQIQQVVVNLVRNAVDAVQGREDRRIAIGAFSADGGMVEICVRDNGPGLSADAAAVLFTPFVSTKPDGMGIGLSISRTIVEAHGGRIWADPPGEPGATFRVLLPLAPRKGRPNGGD